MTIKTNGMATVHSAFPWQALPKFPEMHTEHFQGIIVQVHFPCYSQNFCSHLLTRSTSIVILLTDK